MLYKFEQTQKTSYYILYKQLQMKQNSDLQTILRSIDKNLI